jgi:hypothetical protein
VTYAPNDIHQSTPIPRAIWRVQDDEILSKLTTKIDDVYKSLNKKIIDGAYLACMCLDIRSSWCVFALAPSHHCAGSDSQDWLSKSGTSRPPLHVSMPPRSH